MRKVDKKILAIDDDLNMDKMLVFLFETRGYEIQFADNGEDALELLKSFKPDLVILDLLMPGMNGFEVCEKIKSDADSKQIPVIVLSALPAEIHEERARSLGVFDYLEKPFSSKELLEKAEEAIG